MFRLILLPVLCTLVICTAIPATLEARTCPSCDQSFVVGFDRLAAPAGGISLNAQPPPTPHENLKYVNLKVQSQPVLSALRFQSPSNAAVVDTLATLQGNNPILTRDYPNSPVTSFDLRYFYFGCKLASGAQGNAGPAQNCTVQIIGKKPNANNPSFCDTVTAICSFSRGAATNLYNVPEAKCVLPSNFKTLFNATITITNTETANQLTVLYTDDYSYTTHGVCCP